jgi:hypothetical protein
MTEAEWLICVDPVAMLAQVVDRTESGRERITNRISDRKLKLICQHVGEPLFCTAPTGEGYPDRPYHWLLGWLGAGDEDDKVLIASLIRDVVGNPWRPHPFSEPVRSLAELDRMPASSRFRRVGPHMKERIERIPDWLTDHVVSMAQAIYDDRDFISLPILADALSDAGCNNADLLSHLRQPSHVHGTQCRDQDGVCVWESVVHCRGCWAVDLLLGME